MTRNGKKDLGSEKARQSMSRPKIRSVNLQPSWLRGSVLLTVVRTLGILD